MTDHIFVAATDGATRPTSSEETVTPPMFGSPSRAVSISAAVASNGIGAVVCPEKVSAKVPHKGWTPSMMSTAEIELEPPVKGWAVLDATEIAGTSPSCPVNVNHIGVAAFALQIVVRVAKGSVMLNAIRGPRALSSLAKFDNDLFAKTVWVWPTHWFKMVASW